MNYLDAEEILLIHYKLIENYGGSHGTRDLERIKSASVAPARVVFGEEQYPDIFQKAAVNMRSAIIADHPFVDGNKRTGMAVAAMFLQKNGYRLILKTGELENFAVHVATNKPSIEEITSWLSKHTQK